MGETMTPEQALALLDQVCQTVPANRQVHAQIQEAVKILADVLKKQKLGA